MALTFAPRSRLLGGARQKVWYLDPSIFPALSRGIGAEACFFFVRDGFFKTKTKLIFNPIFRLIIEY